MPHSLCSANRCLLMVWAALVAIGCDRDPQAEIVSSIAPPAARYAVEIRQPADPPRIATGVRDSRGEEVAVACSVCHTTKPAEVSAQLGQPLTEFHQHVVGPHGNLTCVSCHHAGDGYDSLHLADHRQISYQQVMQLCAQCHSSQYRDYQRGAHGGMTGYWDLSRGPRTRNNCVDCHAPHAPQFIRVMPDPGPNDRFLQGAQHE